MKTEGIRDELASARIVEAGGHGGADNPVRLRVR